MKLHYGYIHFKCVSAEEYQLHDQNGAEVLQESRTYVFIDKEANTAPGMNGIQTSSLNFLFLYNKCM